MDAYSKDYLKRLEEVARTHGLSFCDIFEAVYFAEKHGWKPRSEVI